MPVRNFIALIAICFLATSVRAAQFGQVTVDPLPRLCPVAGPYGYRAYRFLLINTGTTPRRITLRMPAHHIPSSGPYLGEVKMTYDLRGHTSQQVTLLQPALRFGGRGLAVDINGSYRGALNLARIRQRMRSVILLSPNVSRKLYARMVVLANGSARTIISGPGSNQLCACPMSVALSNLPMAQWSGNWLAYSSLAAIVVDRRDFQAMRPAVRRAIWAYTRCGGILLLLDGRPADIPATWRHWKNAPFDAVTGKAYTIGFGVCWELPEHSASRWHVGLWNVLVSACTKSAGALAVQSVTNANNTFAVSRDIKIPRRRLLGILALFAVIVGPVNLLVLAAMGKRMWLWITIPAAALLFAAGVFFYTVSTQGWSGLRRATTFTILDQTRHQATTLGWIGYYCPLTPGGLRFDRQTELTPEVAADFNGVGPDVNLMDEQQNGQWSSLSSPRAVNWTHGQYLASGWVAAREPADFALRKAASSSAKVGFSRSASGLVIAHNQLGAAISKLWYADATGQLFRGGPIAAGATATLHRSRQVEPGGAAFSLRAIFSTGQWPTEIATLANTMPKALPQQTYWAVLSTAPFLEPGLPETKLRPAPSLVFGIAVGGHHAR